MTVVSTMSKLTDVVKYNVQGYLKKKLAFVLLADNRTGFLVHSYVTGDETLLPT